jgi:hypothetical protein
LFGDLLCDYHDRESDPMNFILPGSGVPDSGGDDEVYSIVIETPENCTLLSAKKSTGLA